MFAVRSSHKALDNDKARAEKALLLIQRLYAIERQSKQDNLTPQQIKELILKESLLVINEMGKWIFEEIKSTLPKSQNKQHGILFFRHLQKA